MDEELKNIMAKSISKSARYNKRHKCTRPELPAAMCDQIAEDNLKAIEEAGYIILPPRIARELIETEKEEDITEKSMAIIKEIERFLIPVNSQDSLKG